MSRNELPQKIKTTHSAKIFVGPDMDCQVKFVFLYKDAAKYYILRHLTHLYPQSEPM